MSSPATAVDTAIERLDVSCYTIPTDFPEADGTFAWDRTTLVVVEATAGGQRGLGYTYADTATARFVNDVLAPVVQGRDALAVPAAWTAQCRAVRNLGRAGVAAMAISAVDAALWDLKGRLLDLPVVSLLGAAQAGVTVYGSGGFTTYALARLQEQLAGWVADGLCCVKMKIGSHADEDVDRARAARAAIGPKADLFVDANGAYSRKEALAMAAAFAALGVSWFEEPVSADDLEGLHLLRDRGPVGVDIAAGEYGYDLFYFRRMLDAGAVDVLQADASRCLGITGFLQVGALCAAHGLPLSAHCAPSLHVHPGCALPMLRHLECFHDHVRIEHLLFDGALTPSGGKLYPNLSRPGLGLDLKRADAEQYAVASF
jgi:L-alanine-DL-glutamate epimerase-like enolase superfamily enzyme